ncbi:MAG: HEPN domain-containing protein [Lachnospiraceae bacterium]
MESSVIQLSQYRFSRAKEVFHDAETLLEQKSFASSVNRSYYAIFHALRAVTALDGFDSSKHSGVIAYINRQYVKTGIFDKRLSKILDTTFRLREKADYDDFIVISFDAAKEQLAKAEEVIRMIKPYLEEKWEK